MKYSFFAYHLKEKLKLKDLEKVLPFKPHKISSDEIVYKLAPKGYLFFYRFGTMVFFNIPNEDRAREIERIVNTLRISEEVSTSEEFFLETEGTKEITVMPDSVRCPALSYDIIYITSLVLAQSASLEYFELTVDEMLNRSRHITRDLEIKGRIEAKTKELMRYIGFSLTTRQEIISKLYILDKPEFTWDKPVLDKLYNHLSNSFELQERYKLLDYKFQMIQDSLEIISDLVRTRREFFLEILIILLIAIEVVLFVYDLFFK